MNGVIKVVKDNFGFILGEDGKDYFFHAGAMDISTGIQLGDLEEGLKVDFREYMSAKGPRATNIRLV